MFSESNRAPCGIFPSRPTRCHSVMNPSAYKAYAGTEPPNLTRGAWLHKLHHRREAK